MKIRLNDWTKVLLPCILSSLIFPGYLCLGQEGPETDVKSGESLELREAKVARESAEKRVLDLELELEKLRRDYTTLRSKYAELYVDTYKAVRSMRDLEMNAARLVQNRDGKSRDDGRDEVLEALELVLSRQLELQNALRSFQEYLSAAMDVLRPSEAVKEELDKRGGALREAVENSMKPLSALALRTSGNGPGTCSVVSVNDERQLFIIDRGTLSGVRPGRKWRLVGKNGEVEAVLLTVDARPEISALIVTEGSYSSVRTGSVLSAE